MDYPARTRQNESRVFAAEQSGDEVVNAWPMTAYFEFTADCNLHCSMCGCEMARDRHRAAGIRKFSMPVETFRMIAREAFPHVSIVNPTTVGEPLMIAYLDELVEACRTYSVKLDVITNAMLLRGERVRRLLPVLGSIHVSFDGASKSVFEHVRTGADFDVVMANLREFREMLAQLPTEHRPSFAFSVTITSENVEELAEIVRIAADLRVDFVAGSFMLVLAEHLLTSSPLLDPERTNRGLAEARAVAGELGVKLLLPPAIPAGVHDRTEVEVPDVANVRAPNESVDRFAVPSDGPGDGVSPAGRGSPPVLDPVPIAADTGESAYPVVSPVTPGNWQGKYFCRFPWRAVFVGYGGEVAPCCSPGRPTFGNAFERDFMSIWNGPEYRRLRRGLFLGDPPDYCRRCAYLQESGQTGFDRGSYVSFMEV